MPKLGGPAAVTWGQPAGALHLFIPLHNMPKHLVPNRRGPCIQPPSALVWQGFGTGWWFSSGVASLFEALCCCSQN